MANSRSTSSPKTATIMLCSCAMRKRFGRMGTKLFSYKILNSRCQKRSFWTGSSQLFTAKLTGKNAFSCKHILSKIWSWRSFSILGISLWWSKIKRFSHWKWFMTVKTMCTQWLKTKTMSTKCGNRCSNMQVKCSGYRFTNRLCQSLQSKWATQTVRAIRHSINCFF